MSSYVERTLAAFERLEEENAKLLEQIHWLKKGDILHVLTDQEYIDQCERERLVQVSIDALDKENAKLRELARMMWLACKRKGIVGGIYAYPDKNSNADERILFEPLLRELGIEGV